MKWEYRKYIFASDPSSELEETLNELGEEGWELIINRDGIYSEERHLVFSTYIFKRPKVEVIEFPQPFLGDLT